MDATINSNVIDDSDFDMISDSGDCPQQIKKFVHKLEEEKKKLEMENKELKEKNEQLEETTKKLENEAQALKNEIVGLTNELEELNEELDDEEEYSNDDININPSVSTWQDFIQAVENMPPIENIDERHVSYTDDINQVSSNNFQDPAQDGYYNILILIKY